MLDGMMITPVHVRGSGLSGGQPVRIAGINWYGFETPDMVAHGLWAQDYHTIIDDMKNLGYNTIRIPFSNQMVGAGPGPAEPQLLQQFRPDQHRSQGPRCAADPRQDHHLRGAGRAEGHPR